MAYKINRRDEFVVNSFPTADGLATQKDIREALYKSTTRTPEFYELEPA